MAKSADLVGLKFGSLTVLERLPEREDRYWLWRCRCDCGGEICVNTKRLIRGTITNCGCIPKQTARNGSKAENLEGRRFGRLTVIHRVESAKGRTRWLCQCDCGKMHTASAHELKAGKTTSCGCKRKLESTGIMDIKNKRFGRLVALSPTELRDTKGSVFWHCRCDCGAELDVTEDGLVHGNYRSCGCLKKEIQQDIINQLHRIDGTCVEWLEKRKHRCDNTSGFRGVYRLENGKFRVSIGFKGKRYHIGTYRTFEEAVENRLNIERLIHDDFVKAYYIWKAQIDSAVIDEPLIFEVEKINGRFHVITNMDI